MNEVTQPLDSSNLCSIPVKFIEEGSGYTPMNTMQKHLIDGLKNSEDATPKQCRICLQGEKEGRMVMPCKCTGSVKYTHSKCLIEWIKRKMEATPRIKARCELCDTEFRYRLTQNRTFDCEQLKRNYTTYKSSIRNFAIAYGIFLLIFFGVIGVLIYSSTENGAQIKKTIMPNSTTAVIIVTILVLYFIIMMVITVLFISQYVVRQEIVINEVFNYSEQPNFVKNFKIYFRR